MQDVLEINRCFANVLISFRKKALLSQERLAEAAGVDRTYISLLERGHRQPTIKTIFALAGALNVSPHEIIIAVEKQVQQ